MKNSPSELKSRQPFSDRPRNLCHEELMRLALDQARLALNEGDVPIGAIVVDAQGQVIGRGYNRREADHSTLR